MRNFQNNQGKKNPFIKYGLLFFILITTIFSVVDSNLFEEKSMPKNELNNITYIRDAVISRISLVGNDWTTDSIYAKGEGSSGNPFIIRDQIIDLTGETAGTAGISITNSTAYGKIVNCTVYGGSVGIFLYNCENVEMIDNFFYDLSGNGVSINGTSPNNKIIGNNCSGCGISMTGANNTIINDNRVRDVSLFGINMQNSNHLNLFNNSIINSGYQGFRFTGVNYSTAYNNNVSLCTGEGIFFASGCVDNQMSTGEVFSTAGVCITSSDSIFLSHYKIYDSVTGIDVISPHCTFLSNNITYSNFDGIYLYNSPNANVTENRISNSDGQGINMYNANLSVVGLNVIEISGHNGIHMDLAGNSNLTGNFILNSSLNGASVWNSPNCQIKQNNFVSNTRYGIEFQSSTNCNLIDCNITGNGQKGVQLYESHSAVMNLNSITKNGDTGIFNIDSDGCIISENTISRNGDYPISITSDADNNEIYENYFIKNWNYHIYDGGSGTNIHDNYYTYFMMLSITSDEWVNLGIYANFTASPIEGSLPYAYEWDFGDSTTSTDQNPSHIYAESGVYIVTCTVTDADGDATSSSREIIVLGENTLNAAFTVSGPPIPHVNDLISFTDTTTGGNAPISYYWDFGDSTSSIEQNPEHYYSSVGNFVVTLTVTDGDGDIDSATAIIAIVDDLELIASFIVSSTLLVEGEKISFVDTTTGGNAPLTYFWDFGDASTSILQHPTNIYEDSGDYLVILLVTDVDGDESEFSLIVTIAVPIITGDDDNGDDDGLFGNIPGYPTGLFILIISISGFGIYHSKRRTK